MSPMVDAICKQATPAVSVIFPNCAMFRSLPTFSKLSTSLPPERSVGEAALFLSSSSGWFFGLFDYFILLFLVNDRSHAPSRSRSASSTPTSTFQPSTLPFPTHTCSALSDMRSVHIQDATPCSLGTSLTGVRFLFCLLSAILVNK